LGLLDAATGLPGDGGALLPGLAVGDTSAVGDSLDSSMKVSALSHLTAVSGANCAVVIALVFFASSALGLPRGLRIGASVAALAGFVVLVTPEPSVLRAAVMATLVLVTLGSGRPVRGVPVLSVAVLVLLVIDPWLARSYGFALSVFATAGLLLLAEPIARRLARWLPYPLALVIAVPVAAQLACQPVLILLSPALPGYGVVANILSAPAAPAATVLGLAGCVLLPVVPLLGEAVTALAWVPSAWIAGVATFFSELPGAQLPWPADGWGVVLAAGCLALIVVMVRARGAAASHFRVGAAAVLAISCACYAGVVGGDQVRRRIAPPGDWVIAACDVGQGDAVLVRSAGEVALIDTGPDEALLDDCLDLLGIAHIDLLVLTHFDLDHVGGAAAVLGRVSRVLVGPSSGPQDDALVQRLTIAGALQEQAARGRSGALGELRWRILWPPARLGTFSTGNDASVVIAFEGGADCRDSCISSVFLGDLGEQSQDRMLGLNSASLGSVDVVKVAHHGSRDQSPRLYDRLQAGLGIVGVGADNDYGHPTDQTLALLAATGTTVARTDVHGLSLVSVRDGVTFLWTERGADGGAE
jgi:competence protein ComEC